MKKAILIIISLAFILNSCSVADSEKGKEVLEFPREFSVPLVENDSDEVRAIWFSYLDYSKTLANLSENDYRAKIQSIFSEISAFGFNTVIFQVRSHSDSFYDSAFFPMSALVAGNLGGGSDFDPLKIAVETAHSLNLKIEAWINPLRGHTDAEAKSLDDSLTFKQWYNDETKKGINIVLVGERWYYNPAVSEVRDLISSGVREICEGYDIDGIHIDDYFYPTTDEAFDKTSFEEMGEGLTLDEFRRNSVNLMVKDIYSTVKSVDEEIVFGISPQGNLSNCFNKCYADVYSWCSEEGFADYIAPQLYYSFKQNFLPFDDALKQWQQLIKLDGLNLYIGLAGYKVAGKYSYSTEEERIDWSENRDMLSRQVLLSREQKRYNGFIVFSYASLFIDNDEETLKEKENLKKIL